MNETNISAADLARLVALVATIPDWHFDIDEGDGTIYFFDSEGGVVTYDDWDEGERRAAVDVLNAAPSLLAEVGRLRAERAAIEGLLSKTPAKEPERYEGDNHGDSFSSGWDCGEWSLASALRAALSPSPEVGT